MTTPSTHNQFIRMPLVTPSLRPIAYGDNSSDISSGTCESSFDLSPADESLEPETFDLSRCSINLNLELTGIKSPFTKDSMIRRSTDSELSSCDLSRCENNLYDDINQDLQNFMVEGQRDKTEVISYDSFLAKINESNHSISSISVASPSLSQIKQFEIPTKLPNPKPKPPQNLKYFKEQALLREKQREIKRLAVVRIQAWYRARRIRCIYKPILKRFLEDRRLAILDEIKERLDFIQAALRIQKAIRKYLLRKKQMKADIWRKYLNMCVEIIQKNWRRYTCRKHYLQNIKSIRQKRNSLVKAYVRGWKTRKILQNPIIKSILKNIPTVDSQARKILKEELAGTFNMMYITGSWTKKPKADPKPFLRKSQREAQQAHKTNPLVRTKEIMFSESKLKNSQEITVPMISESEAYVESVNIPDTYRSKSQAPLLQEPSSAQNSNKEFLKRKSKQIQMQKVDWGHVNRRIDCWVDKDGVQHTKSEMGRHRRPKSSTQHSNLFVKDQDSSSTASTTPNEIISSPSLKPKLIHFGHSPRAHIRIVSMKSPRSERTPKHKTGSILHLLKPDTSNQPLASPRSTIRVKPIRGQNTLLHLNDMEKLYEDDEANFKPWCINLVSDSIPLLNTESVFFSEVKESEVLERVENLRVEYVRLCNN